MKQAEKETPLNIFETKKLAESLLKHISSDTRSQALVIGLYGDLGAGKTTFMQFFGHVLGVKEKILSPTFVIEKIYKIDHKNFDHLIHIDAYRIENPKELVLLGWKEIVADPKNIICVEWADKVAHLLPKDQIRIKFSHHGLESRLISIEK